MLDFLVGIPLLMCALSRATSRETLILLLARIAASVMLCSLLLGLPSGRHKFESMIPLDPIPMLMSCSRLDGDCLLQTEPKKKLTPEEAAQAAEELRKKIKAKNQVNHRLIVLYACGNCIPPTYLAL